MVTFELAGPFQYRLAHPEDQQGLYRETRRVALTALETGLA